MKVSSVAKTIVAAVAAGVAAVVAATTDGTVTTNEMILVGLAVLTALGVYTVPNTDV